MFEIVDFSSITVNCDFIEKLPAVGTVLFSFVL